MSADNAAFAEGARIMTICNACRYCEGYCAVFPAMERRLTFEPADLEYLANLCHNCGDCLPACQYAPPHEFAVDVPRVLTEIRNASYRRAAWPQRAAPAFAGGSRFATRASVIGVVLFALATLAFGTISKTAMIVIFLLAALYVIVALAGSIANAWRNSDGPPLRARDAFAAVAALRDALTLRNLGGGGEGCLDGDARLSRSRRIYHHLAFYGFTLCFAATVVAAIYDNVYGWPPPYPLLSAPVVLGTVGGVTLIAGAAGLLRTAIDTAFIIMLLLVASTGLLLLALRATPLMGTLLAVHLGVVLGLFVTMPYGKFVHAFYRFAALARDAIERRAA